MKYVFVLLSAGLLVSCNWFKQKTKDTVNKGGEIVAKAGSEFADGVSKGVQKTFSNEVRFSPELTRQGLKASRVLVSGTEGARDNKLSAYLIFDSDFDKEVVVKVYDVNGLEYGRVRQVVKGKKGDAGYVDFVFDSRTNIDFRGTVSVE